MVCNKMVAFFELGGARRAGTPQAFAMSSLLSALTDRVVVEQAKGFLHELLEVSLEDAFVLLRTYARANGKHLSDVARQLMTDRMSRPTMVAEMSELRTPPTH